MNNRGSFLIILTWLFIAILLAACDSPESEVPETPGLAPETQVSSTEPVDSPTGTTAAATDTAIPAKATAGQVTETPETPAPEPTPDYQSYMIGEDIWALVVADLNGDNQPDIAATDKAGETLKILFNQGDGEFGQLSEIFIGYGAWGVVAADFNRDAHLDLAVALTPEDEAGILSVHLNNGDGTFRPAETYEAIDSAWPTASDFDGDGDQDLVLDVSTEKYPAGDKGVGLWFNNGDGSFQAGDQYYFEVHMIGNVVANDLNNDNIPDLVVRYYPEPSLGVLMGNGDGSFGRVADYKTARNNHWVMSADLNGDDAPDLVSAGAEGIINVLFNNGDGTFQEKHDYDVGGNIYTTQAVDMDGDGALDLMVGPTGSAMASLLTYMGDGVFELTQDYYFKGAWVSFFEVADVDGDGYQEMVGYGGDSVFIFSLDPRDY